MNEPIVSVIIPVYNVEKYLTRCVDSVLNQTYKNLDIILVDDGSKDNSGKICDDYSRKDNRIKVIHQKNRGQSCARNIGLKNCKGEYVTFVDSDDWIAKNYYEYCIELIEKYKADVIQIGVSLTKSEGLTEKITPKIMIFDGKECLDYFMTTTVYSGAFSVCRCLFDNRILKSIEFREGKINEDIDYKYRVLSNAKRMVVSNQVKYFYFQGDISTTKCGLRKKDFDLYDAAEELWNLAKDEDYGDIRFYARVKKARTAFSLLCKIAYYGIADDKIDEDFLIKKLTKEHRINTKILLKAPIPISRKILCVLFFINFSFTSIFIKIAKRLIRS